MLFHTPIPPQAVSLNSKATKELLMVGGSIGSIMELPLEVIFNQKFGLLALLLKK